MARLDRENRRRQSELNMSRPASGPPVRNQGGFSRPVASKPKPFVPSAPRARARKDSIVRPVIAKARGPLPPPPNRIDRGNATGTRGPAKSGRILPGSAEFRNLSRPEQIKIERSLGGGPGSRRSNAEIVAAHQAKQDYQRHVEAASSPGQVSTIPAPPRNTAPGGDPRVVGQVGDTTDLSAAQQNYSNAKRSGDPEFLAAATNRLRAAQNANNGGLSAPGPAEPVQAPGAPQGQPQGPQQATANPAIPGATPPGPTNDVEAPFANAPQSVQDALARIQGGQVPGVPQPGQGGVPEAAKESLARLRDSGHITQDQFAAMTASVPAPPGSPQAQGATVPQPPQVTPDGQPVPNGPDGQPLKQVQGKVGAEAPVTRDGGNESQRRAFQDTNGTFYDRDGRVSSLQGINPDTGQPDQRHAQSPVQGMAQGIYDRTLQAAGGEISKLANGDPVRTRELQQDAQRQIQEFGEFPSQDDPDAPPPPIRPGGRSFNPFSGKYTATNQPPAFKMLGITEEHEEAWKQEYMQRVNGGLV